jgi:drug/metabolite transporter (DMT)-like permease
MVLWGETLPWQAWVGVILIVASGLLATVLSGRMGSAAVAD